MVRAFSADKSKIPQIYDKIMKLCLNAIRFILAETVERDILENHWHQHFFEHITFFLQNATIYRDQWKANFMLIQLLKNTMPWKFLFLKILSVERLLLTLFFLICCVLVKTKTGMHFREETLNILEFT